MRCYLSTLIVGSRCAVSTAVRGGDTVSMHCIRLYAPVNATCLAYPVPCLP
jgi:hypothetical protein